MLLAVLLSQIPALGSTMSGLGAVGRSPALEQPPEQRRMVRARRDNVPKGLCKPRGAGKMLVLMITLQHVNYMLTLESGGLDLSLSPLPKWSFEQVTQSQFPEL